MTYRQAANLAGTSVTELKKVFKPVLEAYEEIGLPAEISKEMLDLWQHGSLLRNWLYTLDKLNARKMLLDHVPGANGRVADEVIKGGLVVDPWTLYLSAALYTIGEPLPAEFDERIGKPIQAHLEKRRIYQEKIKEERAKANSILAGLRRTLEKAAASFDKIDPNVIHGLPCEIAKNKINQLIELAKNAEKA
ncbi:hypothetical protein [Hydrogenimonas urashimensis]|uniref:hypothetical protein n=1 Tax=Hydrogenimonas urashimensis TaxID=2740515 RepID=UPI001916A319|nr:hypothetical protein [Hydrogenimonas urashimensis]